MPSAFLWPVLVPSALRAPAPVNLGVRPQKMHKLFATLLATLGFASAVKADSPIQYADPKTIRFTTPTLSMDEIEYVVPTKQSFEGVKRPGFRGDQLV
jgi:hypothetical protein